MSKNKKSIIFSEEVARVLAKPNTKIFVMDTSVMVHDPKAINKFGDNLVVIPIWNIEELDKLKNSFNGKGASAREVSRILDDYRLRGSLRNGVLTDEGGVLVVDYSGNGFSDLPVGLEKNNDNRTIIIARKWKKTFPEKEIVIVSKDINLRIKAESCEVLAQDFKGDKRISSINDLYSGSAMVEICDPDVLENIHRFGSEIIENRQFVDKPVLLENTCCKIFFGNRYALAIYKGGHFELVRKNKKNDKEKAGVQPSNDEQCLAYHLLMDKNIPLVTLGGHAGTGKTLIALLAAVEQLDKIYEQIIVYRPNCEIGQPLGFLPGDIDEKFAPWTMPITDNLKLILKESAKASKKDSVGTETIESLLSSKKVTIEPLNFIRGRSINKTFILVDEAQNIRPEDAKTVITRAGAGTKVVLVGDVTQIDNPYVDSISNGLTSVIEGFKGDGDFGHILLTESRRSRLSEKAARIL